MVYQIKTRFYMGTDRLGESYVIVGNNSEGLNLKVGEFVRLEKVERTPPAAGDRTLKTLRQRVREKLRAIAGQQEFILEAFIAETGCKPSECEQVQRTDRAGNISWHIQKRAKVKNNTPNS